MTCAMPALGVVSVLALSACAVAPPQGPTVMALPAQGKSFEAFQQDDGTCRGYATQQTGGASASQAATNSAVGSAVLGTALGAYSIWVMLQPETLDLFEGRIRSEKYPAHF